MMNTKKSLFLLVATIAGLPVFAASDSEESRADVAREERTLTIKAVRIDALGADPDTRWHIHTTPLNVRDAPAKEGSRILGGLTADMEVSGRYLIVEESDEEWLEIDFQGQKGYISRLGFSRIHPRNKELIDRYGNLPYGREIVNRWWGIPLDYEADDLVTIPEEYTRQIEGRSYELRAEAAKSVAKMIAAMRADGLEIYVSSPYRSGATQTSIYRRRMERSLSQRGVAPPGHSEHQLGTTVDFFSTLEGRSLRNTDPQHAWLEANGARYGWRQTYRGDNTSETGYIEEPWHWRYMGVEAIRKKE